MRFLETRGGRLEFPFFVPVTTFGRYPLDDLIRPYLPRLCQAVMVSHYYAQKMPAEQRPDLPLFIDSGGFAALFENSEVVERNGLGVIVRTEEDKVEEVDPFDVLEFQEQHADVAYTLDFPIPPGMERQEATKRQALTIANACWALENRRRRDLPLYATLVGLTLEDYLACLRAYNDLPFDGLAIGGLVPRTKKWSQVVSLISQIRALTDKPL
ncbi:MAG: queuine tRNA-ribosyltransferase family protein, partial [Desulfuromonadales bacterium]|nr:queuine tRNA-ribosyltransferase family protein [Desulfuromonadales bacterium]